MLPLSSFWKREKTIIIWFDNSWKPVRPESGPTIMTSLGYPHALFKVCPEQNMWSKISKQHPLCQNVLHNPLSCKTTMLTKHRLTMTYQDTQFPLNRDELSWQIWRVILIEILNARMPMCGSLLWPNMMTNKSLAHEFGTILCLTIINPPCPSESKHLMSSSRTKHEMRS